MLKRIINIFKRIYLILSKEDYLLLALVTPISLPHLKAFLFKYDNSLFHFVLKEVIQVSSCFSVTLKEFIKKGLVKTTLDRGIYRHTLTENGIDQIKGLRNKTKLTSFYILRTEILKIPLFKLRSFIEIG